MQSAAYIDDRNRAESYIKVHWLKMNDDELAKKTGISVHTIRKYRSKLKLVRPKKQFDDRTAIALTLEFFATGVAIRRISKMINISEETVKALLNRYYYFKPKSPETITLTIESSINYQTN